MDSSKTYDYNLWYTPIKTSQRDASFVLRYIGKSAKLLKKDIAKKCRIFFFPIKKNKSKVVTLATVAHDNFPFVFVL